MWAFIFTGVNAGTESGLCKLLIDIGEQLWESKSVATKWEDHITRTESCRLKYMLAFLAGFHQSIDVFE